jgi:hypothetical protein
MKQFEYKTITNPDAEGKTLADFGLEGWELCVLNLEFFILKREIQKQPTITYVDESHLYKQIMNLLIHHQEDWPDATSGEDCFGICEENYDALTKRIINVLKK